MTQYLVIGNGKVKNSLTFSEETVTNHIHSAYNDEKTALRMAHWLNSIRTGLRYHVEEKEFNFSA